MVKAVLGNALGLTGLRDAIPQLLADPGSSGMLDLLGRAMRTVENDPTVPWVGRGGAPNALGEMEFDSGVMIGRDLQVAAVGSVRNVVEVSSLPVEMLVRNFPHVMLVGDGAERFARESGHPTNSDALTPAMREQWRAWFTARFGGDAVDRLHEVDLVRDAFSPQSAVQVQPKDTVVFAACDDTGRFAAMTSTSGAQHKFPGRLGDSPICGAGFFALDDVGAVLCTHKGELAIRTGAAATICTYMELGKSPEDACRRYVRDRFSKLPANPGELVIHVLGRDGDPFVCSLGISKPVTYCYWNVSTKVVEERPAVKLL
jgi:isoaspartyl peptidase/L-asparaginase-like protein (Ntn-hydrolase superfamily)